MNIEQLNKKWLQIRVEIKRKWPAITEEALEQLKTGEADLISLLVNQYNLSVEDATEAAEEIIKKPLSTDDDVDFQEPSNT